MLFQKRQQQLQQGSSLQLEASLVSPCVRKVDWQPWLIQVRFGFLFFVFLVFWSFFGNDFFGFLNILGRCMSSGLLKSSKSAGAWLLKVWVKPGARSNQITEVTDDVVHLRISAPARENAANEAVAAYMGSVLGVRPRAVTVVQGHKSREKVLEICNISNSADAEALIRSATQLEE